MNTDTAWTPEPLDWNDFVADVPDRAIRRVIKRRDDVAAKARDAERTQSWSPSSARSEWWTDLVSVVDAIDALKTAHDAVNAAENEDEHEERVLARSDAFEALVDAVEAAERRARELAAVVAEVEAENGAERVREILEEDGPLASILDRHGDGDRGWTAVRAEDGSIIVSGWATPRCVMGDDCGGPVLGGDVEAEIFEVAVATPALLGLVDVTAEWRQDAILALAQEDAKPDDPAWMLAGDPDEDVVSRVVEGSEVAPVGAVIVHSNGHAALFVPRSWEVVGDGVGEW